MPNDIDCWVCEECGEDNVWHLSACSECHCPKPGPTTPPNMSRSSTPVHPSVKTEWTCEQCNSSNCPDDSECHVCRKPKSATGQYVEPKPERSGDWICRYCKGNNFANRESCFTCKAFKEDSTEHDTTVSAPIVNDKPGWTCQQCNSSNQNNDSECQVCKEAEGPEEWTCTACNVSNHPNYTHCSSCHAPHNNTPVKDNTQTARVGDWICRYCKGNNFANRESCFTCKAFKEDAPTKSHFLQMKKRHEAPAEKTWQCQMCVCVNRILQEHCMQCGHPQNQYIEPLNINWVCKTCGAVNYAFRTICYVCDPTQSEQSAPSRTTHSSYWVCPSCKNPNTGLTGRCSRCLYTKVIHNAVEQSSNIVRPPAKRKCPPEPPQMTHTPNSVNYIVVPEDWTCPSCESPNIALRNFCKECDSARKSIAKLYIRYKKMGLAGLLDIQQPAELANSGKKVTNHHIAHPPRNESESNAYYDHNENGTPPFQEEADFTHPIPTVSSQDPFFVCSNCRAKNHPHKTACVRCSQPNPNIDYTDDMGHSQSPLYSGTQHNPNNYPPLSNTDRYPPQQQTQHNNATRPSLPPLSHPAHKQNKMGTWQHNMRSSTWT